MILVIASVLGFIYSCLIGYHLMYYKEYDKSAGLGTLKRVSIVIVARNESVNIKATLEAIAANDYPHELYEIILVDDHSEDDTIAVANACNLSNLKVLPLKDKDISQFGPAYKKAGQYYGIQIACHPYILTTDADCICTPSWIREMLAGVAGADIATGPIDITGGKSSLALLQRYDNIATMMTTAVGIQGRIWYSANAANMIFKKELYRSYQSEMTTTHASGDDVMFLQWATLKGYKARFVNATSAIISTEGMTSWRDFLRQRLRWASKSGAYLHQGLNYIWALVFLYDVVLLSSILSLISDLDNWIYVAVLLGTKTVSDAILLSRGVRSYRYRYPIIIAPLLSLLHAGYVVVVGISSLFAKNYTWKDRRVS